MEHNDRCSPEEVDGDSCGSSAAGSLEMDRNPSPPPEKDETEAGEEVDAIGETVYSKHWLFSTLTRLIQMVTDQESGLSDSSMELTDDLEEDLCKVWDMAMDKDVAVFLQEFKAPDILLGVIAKSCSPRLTEICIGILGNMACFHDTCVSLSQSSDLCAVLLLLLGDNDPPTLLETCRLLLTCMSQPDVAPLWLERIQQQPMVCSSLCFIMSSSTNVDLLVKVGELVDKLFDEDEEMMKSWVSTPPSNTDPNKDTQQDVVSSLLEAATQLRSESPEDLEVYLHSLQLLTTAEEGMQALVSDKACGRAVWTFVCKIVCEDLCQADDPPLILQEQKALLVSALALLSALHSSLQTDISSALLGSLIRILQFNAECRQSRTAGNSESEGSQKEEEKQVEDEQLEALVETTAEFLSAVLMELNKDLLSSIVKEGYLTERSCVSAVGTLVPQHVTAVQHLVGLLSEVEPKLADIIKKDFTFSSEVLS
ncbi:protein saal1-like [Sinocyclocheilus anshuiensis]|uniref:Protein saal1-like n=1 Tax=Sinocyclocheilus anshuiensis TaxID=1608454 RepID=A0A671PPW8_9TELE|nr:PREDICTED: protein saal1-like [Sinocyclocheilus anshuiensis]